MKLYVKDNEKMTDEYYQMKEYRYDILLELNEKYYQLNFITPFLLTQKLERGVFRYMKNLIPINDVSLNNVISTIKEGIKYDLEANLLPENDVNINEWIQVL